MIELNCFKATNVKTPTAQLASFERFWESEAPRVGEEGAQGWAERSLAAKQEIQNPALKKKKRKLKFTPTETPAQEPMEGPQPPLMPMTGLQEPGTGQETEIYREWLALEQKREQQGWLPLRQKFKSRAADDDLLDDPERVVVWEGIWLFSWLAFARLIISRHSRSPIPAQLRSPQARADLPLPRVPRPAPAPTAAADERR